MRGLKKWAFQTTILKFGESDFEGAVELFFNQSDQVQSLDELSLKEELPEQH
jgi:hypothetical protein